MFATITPTRGDRPQFLEFCKHQLSRMTIKPDHSYFVDWKPQHDDVDLVTRVKDGIRQAMNDGFNEVYIIEDDDYYPADYFEKVNIGNSDFIGTEITWYYNIRNNTFQSFDHNKVRASLFTTGFKINTLVNFNWPDRKHRYLDVSLWNHAQRFKSKFVDSGAVGIKHGHGLLAGRGHTMRLKNTDHDWYWLKSKVDSEALIFYKSVKL